MAQLKAGTTIGGKLAETVEGAQAKADAAAGAALSAAKAYVDSRLPAGVIVMWSGSITNIPTGWALCDGTNGTPDLRDRFIVGAGGAYAVGATGGAAQVTLTVDQIPPHSHSATTSAAGNHTHSGSIGQAGAHSHQVAGPRASRGGGFQQVQGGQAYHLGCADLGWTADTSVDGLHTHSLTITEAGEHTHTVTIGNTGSGQPHENRPPYYALAYIMKL